MKRILLFITGLMLAVCANAQVYLRGNGDATFSAKEEFLFTDNGDGTHTLTKSFELKSDFKIATLDWSVLNFGSAGEEAKVGTIRVLNGTDSNILVNSLINVTSMTLDTNANTLTIVGENAGEITYSSWTICGVGELVGDAWYPTSTINVMTESDGVYTLIKKNVSLSSDFITDADNPEKATLGYGYKVVADAQWGIKEYPAGGANQFVKIKNNGIYDVIFTFNPSTKELSASATLISESDNNNDYIKDDCYKNGIYYNLDHINKTAEVTFGDKSYADYKKYSGSIIIPASITINSDSYSVTSIGEGAFSSCSGLTSVTIGDKVECIGNRAFVYCTSLKSIEIGKGVVSIGPDSFWGCYSLTSVLWNAKNCKDDSHWEGTPFYSNNESKITSFIFGNEVEHIPAYLCCGLSNLNEVVISNSVTSIGGGTFSSCSNLTKVNYLGTVDEWVEIDFVSDYSNPTYETKELYINNKLLTDIKITSADSIKDYVFYNCESIKSVEIGNNVTYIGSSAFLGCTNLSKVNYLGTVDEWVGIDFTSSLANPTYYAKDLHINGDLLADVKISTAESIKDNTFINCTGIKSVEMGKNVTYIGSSAFLGCENLKKVTAYPTTVPTLYYNSFPRSNAVLYVLCDVYDDYFFDDVFRYFKYIECIAAEEVVAPEYVEIEVDEDNNANVIWPSTDGAKKYELEISKNGEVFCTLLFNENGQLTSIDFGNCSASVGFQFTVTGLDGASKYDYSIAAKDGVENVLESYKGTFTTNGYVPSPDEEDAPTSITDTFAKANIIVSGGTISADADFRIYNTVGKDVTTLNGNLQPGVYIVSIGEDVVKVMVD